MNHIEARAALDNKYLMSVIEKRIERATYSIDSADDNDDRTRFSGVVQRRLLKSILNELETACRIK